MEELRQKKINEISKRIDILWPLYDENKNGCLSNDEAKELFTDIFEQLGHQLDEAQVRGIIKCVDENADGKVSKEEFKDLLLEDFIQFNLFNYFEKILKNLKK